MSFPSVGKTVPVSTNPTITVPPDGWPTDEESSNGPISGGIAYASWAALPDTSGPVDKLHKVRMTFAGQELIDPDVLRSWCLQQGHSPDLFWGRANGFFQKSGRNSGRGYLLMTAASLRSIGVTYTSVATFDDLALISNPSSGDRRFVTDESRVYEYDGAAWQSTSIQKQSLSAQDPVHTLSITDDTRSFDLECLAVTHVQAILPEIDGNLDDLPPDVTGDTAVLVTINDARHYAQGLSSVRRTYNNLLAWGAVDATAGNLSFGDTVTVLWNEYLKPLFGDKDLQFLGTNWADSYAQPTELNLVGLSAWEAFYSLLESYKAGFTLDHAGNPWVYQDSPTMPDELAWKNAALNYRVDSRGNDYAAPIPEYFDVCCNGRDFQWWRKANEPYLTGQDMWRRYPTYKKVHKAIDLDGTLDLARITPGTRETLWCPISAETDDEGIWYDQANVDADLQTFAENHLAAIKESAYQDDLFTGCWPVRVGVYFTGIHWFDHGSGLFTRTISTSCDLPSSVGPCDYENDLTFAGELVQAGHPVISRDRQPWARHVWGRVVDSYLPTGNANVAQDQWATVEVFSGHVAQPASSWIGRQLIRAINFGQQLTVSENPRVYCVWDYQIGRGGEWVIVPAAAASTPGGGGQLDQSVIAANEFTPINSTTRNSIIDSANVSAVAANLPVINTALVDTVSTDPYANLPTVNYVISIKTECLFFLRIKGKVVKTSGSPPNATGHFIISSSFMIFNDSQVLANHIVPFSDFLENRSVWLDSMTMIGSSNYDANLRVAFISDSSADGWGFDVDVARVYFIEQTGNSLPVGFDYF